MPYHEGGEPPWFAAAMAREQAVMRQEITTIRENITAIRADITSMKAGLAQVRRVAAIVRPLNLSLRWFFTDQMQNWNRSSGGGTAAQLEVVPFRSGADPTTYPVNFLHSCLGYA